MDTKAAAELAAFAVFKTVINAWHGSALFNY